MAVFVLVHGAFHGGWCWERVAARLKAAGAEVQAPTLSGLGERAHLGGPGVNLSTHIDDVVGLILREDLREVVLVGHSYSGMVIAGVAHRAPERVRRLVYLDAFVPEDGQSLADIKGREWGESVRRRAEAAGGWSVAAPSSRYFDVKDEADAAWADARLTAQPVGTFLEPVRLGNSAAEKIPATYIACTEQEDSFAALAARLAARGWHCLEIATGHDAMITAPGELAEMLLSIA